MTRVAWGTEVPISDPRLDGDWFTLRQISRWLAVETKGREQLIARALLEDFKVGKFDGPYTTHWALSEASSDFVLAPNLGKDLDLRWRTRWRDNIGRERWALVDSESAQALFVDPADVGGEYDPGETFLLRKEAINQWCDWNDVPRLASWPVPGDSPEAWATEDEILRAIKSLGSDTKWKIPELHDCVSQADRKTCFKTEASRS